jgi:hypothetical protein
MGSMPMYEYNPPPYFDLISNLVWLMAEDLARARRKRLPRPVIPRGKTLRPGPETSCWNLLADAVTPLLRRRGAKALLARELGLNRGRITEFFVKRSAMPDAERLLRLLEWHAWRLASKQPRQSFAPPANVRNTNIR